MNQEWGKVLLFAGIILTIIGAIIYFFPKYVGWIGSLPGDIRIEREGFTLYIPIVTMLLFSLILMVIMRIFRALF